MLKEYKVEFETKGYEGSVMTEVVIVNSYDEAYRKMSNYTISRKVLSIVLYDRGAERIKIMESPHD